VLIISHILASKQGEHLIIKHLGLTSGIPSPSALAMKVYGEMFSGDPAHMQTLRELFPADEDTTTKKILRGVSQRGSKVDGHLNCLG
jgi:hypothetical protein